MTKNNKKDPNRLNLESLRRALADDGKISPKEREELLSQGVPDMICEALADGHLDAAEIAQLTSAGVPQDLLEALADGELTEDEIRSLKTKMVDDMRRWRREQMSALLTLFEKIG